ncbi:uroporphyrinogen-III synthase [Methylobacterium sp. Leaf112]|uniref:uroporphyrinogen-III synthase n=1 Tax=Methylobacterium sp. Leaf112 TaxID=1736258 RepID=UPI0006F6186F|nr:uroporphyrinogen-III synthase [Methylobacterium sp. Leaf112]KQP65921.1 uroporphyrinogen III synthase [Methylobacterium sp. Leaf112]
MRIWVARPEPGATRTGQRLRALGHVPLVAPVLAIRPTGTVLPDGAFAGLLLTSTNAVAALTAADRARFATLPVFAVGARTAALARRAGLGAVREAGGDAAALSALVRATLPAGSALLHVAGAEGKSEPAASLRAAGYAVTAAIAYAAVAEATLPPAVAAALAAHPAALDAVLHYSRRSAETAQLLARRADRSGAFGALKHYCLSSDVAAALAAAGLDAHFVAARPDEESLLAGLVAGT